MDLFRALVEQTETQGQLVLNMQSKAAHNLIFVGVLLARENVLIVHVFLPTFRTRGASVAESACASAR